MPAASLPIRPPAPVPAERRMSRVEALFALRRNPLETWHRVHFEEPIVSGKGLLGFVTVLNDPAAIRHVLVDNAANYPKDDLQKRVLSPGLGNGLLTAEGEGWRRVRRTLAPVFTPRRVAAFLPAMEDAAGRLVRRWHRRGAGAVLDASEEMTRVTFDILARTLFSDSIDGEADAFSRSLTAFFETQGRIDPLDLLGAPDWIPRVGRIRAEPALKFFEERVHAIVARRRALIARGETPPDDLLTALLQAADPESGQGLTEEEVGANIITFIGAGHETTANALTWSLYLASRSPAALATMRAEIAGRDAGGGSGNPLIDLPFTRAVVEEAMRLYPPVATLSRKALKADRIGGHVIPKDSLVVISPWVLHRHKRLWDTPDDFRPERFLPGAREAIDRFAYLPFGAGPRVCIGLQFALQEAVTVLAGIVRSFDFAYAGARPPAPVQRITLRPKRGMPLRIRRPPAASGV